MPYSCDKREFPYVTMTMDGVVEPQDWDQFFADLGELLGHQQHFAVILEVASVKTPDFASLRRMGEWFSSHEAELRRWHRGCAIITSSPMVRGSIKAFRHLHVVPMALEVVDDALAGRRWMEMRVATARPGPDAAAN